MLTANIRPCFQEMSPSEKRRDVVYKLVVGLVTLNWKGSGVSDDRTVARAAGKRETNDRRVVTRAYVYQSRAQSQAITKFAHRSGIENVRPGGANVLLLVV